MAKFCPNCGQKLNGEKFCPACGAPTDPPPQSIHPPLTPPRKRRKGCLVAYLLGLAVLLSMIIAIGLSANKTGINNNNSGSGTAEPSSKAVPNLELIGDTTDEGNGYTVTISGALRNNTRRQYLYVQISFGIYDAGGSKVGTALANVNNLGPSEVWKFSAFYFGTVGEGGSYKLDDITAY